MFSLTATFRPLASLISATGLTALLLAHPPLRAEQGQRSAIVRTDDLDLTRPEGQVRLDRRILTAARRLCQVTGPAPAWRYHEMEQCRTAAIASTAQARAVLVQRAAAH
ncbi:UrcA family protein [Sphingomonas zeicaulis]|uniref:UrcA family protein n=1 Tax=Sphingomonas zeicaulis TaxID=1632740 RepID=UPI003D222075